MVETVAERICKERITVQRSSALCENFWQQEFLEFFAFFRAGVFDLEAHAIVGGGAHNSSGED